jgi:hypothetical protein
VPDGRLENTSGQGGVGTTTVCLPTPAGPPLCTVITTVTITGTTTANSDAFGRFFSWLRGLWNTSSPKWASSNGSYGPVYDEKAKMCDAKLEADQTWCRYADVQVLNNHEQSRACWTNASRDHAQCLSEARQTQKDADAGNEGNDLTARRLLKPAS